MRSRIMSTLSVKLRFLLEMFTDLLIPRSRLWAYSFQWTFLPNCHICLDHSLRIWMFHTKHIPHLRSDSITLQFIAIWLGAVNRDAQITYKFRVEYGPLGLNVSTKLHFFWFIEQNFHVDTDYVFRFLRLTDVSATFFTWRWFTWFFWTFI